MEFEIALFWTLFGPGENLNELNGPETIPKLIKNPTTFVFWT